MPLWHAVRTDLGLDPATGRRKSVPRCFEWAAMVRRQERPGFVGHDDGNVEAMWW